MDIAQIEKSLSKSFEEWVEKLTEDEKNAIFLYTTNAYKEINGYLRNENELVNYTINDIKLIDSALNKFILKNDIIVFRFENRELDKKEKILNLLKRRNYIFYSNFCSTSIDEIEVDNKIKYSLKSNNNVLIIKIKALVSKELKCAYIKNLSEFPEENEVLVIRNVYLVIYHIKEENNIITIYGELTKGED